MKKKYKCPCCGYYTFDHVLDESYDICPVCYWEDDAYLIIAEDSIGALKRPENYCTDEYNGEDVLDIYSCSKVTGCDNINRKGSGLLININRGSQWNI